MMDSLPSAALDDRIAIVGTAGSGKTYAAKGFVERLLGNGARVAIVDPLGVWWGLRSSADGKSAGFPVVVFGGRHADIEIAVESAAPLGRLIAARALATIVDLSELGSSNARRRFMAAFAEALYEANQEPLHLVLDEADLWAPQRPIKGWEGLLGEIEEIVRRGRVRGFIPWLITQRPAVVHKDVLSQADILIAMKLTASQDRDAIGAWIEGQADRAEGKRILAALPQLPQGRGYVWAPGHGILAQTDFPWISTFDSSRTPKRGERLAVPTALAPVDLGEITALLAAASDGKSESHRRHEDPIKRDLAAAKARIAELEAANRALTARLAEVVSLAGAPVLSAAPATATAVIETPAVPEGLHPAPLEKPNGLHPAAGKLLTALARHTPAQFSWGQAATLAGLSSRGGHFNAGRKALRDLGFVVESGELVAASAAGLAKMGTRAAAPTTAAERLALWCDRLPSPAPEMLRALARRGAAYLEAEELARTIGKKPTGGYWNSGIAVLRNNGLIEQDGRRYRIAPLLREIEGS